MTTHTGLSWSLIPVIQIDLYSQFSPLAMKCLYNEQEKDQRLRRLNRFVQTNLLNLRNLLIHSFLVLACPV